MWIFSVEGNIGAGKTTILEKLKSLKFNKPHVVIFEPVDEWMQETDSSDSILELYYKDKKRYAFTFQMFALQTRFEHMYKIMKDNPGKILICERCPLTDYEIFAKMLFESKQITQCEMQIYKRWYDFMDMLVGPKIKGVLYLNVPISTCASRIAKRDRKGEGNITIDYLNTLNYQHEMWLKNECLPYKVNEFKWKDDENSYDMNDVVEFINSIAK